jgi:subtilase family serine protease
MAKRRRGATLLIVCAASAGTLAAVSSSGVAMGTVAGMSAPSGAASGCLLPPASCYSPQQFRVAYGIQPLLNRGIDGRGETVTVVSPVPPPGLLATDIRQDLATFDSAFGLPALRIQVVTTLAGASSPWQTGSEEIEDFEILHTIAPAATLRVVLLPSDVLQSAATATTDMLAALPLAVSRTDVASISWSLGEHYFTAAQVTQMHSILAGAAAHHVTVIASSGDHGASSDPDWGTLDKEVSLPASDPLVLAAGGTVLSANSSTGAYIGETAWNEPPTGSDTVSGGSGGGFSHLYARPGYQDGVPGTSTTRGVPDVAGDADQHGGMALAAADGSGNYIIHPARGTSASASLWGGLMALADQYARHDLGFVNPVVYSIARSPSYRQAFHDVTTGDNTVTDGSVSITGYQAAPGWDPVTGWGSPDAHVLVPLLGRFTSRSKA